ncbi:dehydrogenase/reductase SDR family member on chromosome X-like isoform X2 [Parambassis ranga]|uniref:Dehydrogenase/reductase SDR family member on chromosome X-like isoform X2 n=1 Tax=Parambassis ranga TaxID=210632 RepID=A0A6P7HHN7_9TELE|nr:dehydrogenase/reductase SDR family member on chromosome X-like isoform X2 [Parambassis ranga]
MWSAFRSHLLPVIKLYLLGLKVLLVQLFNRPSRLPVMPRQDGKVAIVTGGGRGIGYEVVRHMARLGAHVIIGGRDEQEGLDAVRRICEEYKEAKVEFKKLDLASLQSVRQFAKSFKQRELPLNILVNNAHCIGEIKLNDLNSCQCYSAHAAYCHSKLAQVLFSSHLHQEMQQGGFPVSSCAVDPGMVDTALYRHMWTPLRLPQTVIACLLFRTPAEGASTVLSAALSPALEGGSGGGYWANGQRENSTPFDPQLQLSLWEVSLQLLGLQYSSTGLKDDQQD